MLENSRKTSKHFAKHFANGLISPLHDLTVIQQLLTVWLLIYTPFCFSSWLLVNSWVKPSKSNRKAQASLFKESKTWTNKATQTNKATENKKGNCEPTTQPRTSTRLPTNNVTMTNRSRIVFSRLRCSFAVASFVHFAHAAELHVTIAYVGS